MPTLRRIELVVHGVLNGQPLCAHALLSVNSKTGVKSGKVEYTCRPPRRRVRMEMVIITGRCHIGALPDPTAPFVGPQELLGREFVSFRLSTVGRYGSLGVSERALFRGDTLYSDLNTVGELQMPPVTAIGPLRETITVVGDDTLVSEGRYSFARARGPPIRVRYTHYYRALHPNRRAFRRLQGAVFLLQVKFANKVRGSNLLYHSTSIIRRA